MKKIWTLSHFEAAIKIMKRAVDETLPEDSVLSTRQFVESLINALENGYLLVEWPDSQDFMEEEWFEDEAILALGSEDKTGGSAYFIPIRRMI